MKYLNKLSCYFGWHKWIHRGLFERYCFKCHMHQLRSRPHMNKWVDGEAESV